MHPLIARDSSPTALGQLVSDWLSRPTLRQLVESFDGTWPQQSGLADQLASLATFSKAWDYRAGVERLDATTAKLTAEQANLVEAASHELGLADTVTPSQKLYDFGLIMGGTATSCLLRTKSLAEQMATGVAAHTIYVLGSDRPISPKETAIAATYAPDAATEFDLLIAAVEHSFTDLKRSDVSVSQIDYGLPNGAKLHLLDVPSGEAGRRTNSGDQYALFRHIAKPAASQSVLISTSQIYYPYHVFGAIRELTLPAGAQIECFGYPREWASDASALTKPTNILQEIRSAILAAAGLTHALDNLAPGLQ